MNNDSFHRFVHSFLQGMSIHIRFPDLKMGEKNVERMRCFKGYENSIKGCRYRESLNDSSELP